MHKDEILILFIEFALNVFPCLLFRQCMCCFREAKNYERFGAITQSIVLMAIRQLRDLKEELLVKLKSEKNNEESVKSQGKFPPKSLSRQEFNLKL